MAGNTHYDTGKEGASRAAGDVCVKSFTNSPFIEVNRLTEGEFHFRDPRGFRYTDKLPYVAEVRKRLGEILPSDLFEQATDGIFLPKGYTETLCADGIGTKVEMANASYNLVNQIGGKWEGIHLSGFRNMARNLIAMSADDIVRHGGIPLVYSNVIDYSKLDDENAIAYRELMLGLGDILEEQNIVLLSGESAGLRQFVGSENPQAFFPFNWSGVMQGLYHEKLKITGEEVAEGDYIVALKQDGVRSNGITKLREALARHYGPEWYNNPQATKFILEAAIPSVVYAKLISDANGWYSNGERKINMTSVAHLSGGGFTDKFFRPIIEKKGLSADLYNLYELPLLVRKCVEWLIGAEKPVDLKGAFDTWSVGQGMFVTVRTRREAEDFIELATSHSVKAQVAGLVVETPKGKNPHLRVRTTDIDGNVGKPPLIIS